MFKSMLNGLYHSFMASRLRAEMPASQPELIDNIVRQNAKSQPATSRRGLPFRNPFRCGEQSYDWRLEVPRIGML